MTQERLNEMTRVSSSLTNVLSSNPALDSIIVKTLTESLSSIWVP